jgi:5-methyltetrahydropteroyltriglutamate--homocysteine methyltransferase
MHQNDVDVLGPRWHACPPAATLAHSFAGESPVPPAQPPFRADQVGSLLRPLELRQARAAAKKGEIGRPALREIEDRCIRDVVKKQEAVGLFAVTDGEFRRDWWHVDFLEAFDGVKAVVDPNTAAFHGADEAVPVLTVTGKLRRSRPVMVEPFKFLQSITKHTAKLAIPSPSMLHMRGGRPAISLEAYPALDEFWADCAQAYREEIRDLAAAGCTYLQLDDVSFAYLCDEKIRAGYRERGDDPERAPRTYADAINAALRGRPAGLTVTIHTCRGNFKSTWMASGGYEPVAEAVFGGLDVDGYFLEYDSERAGGFEPLRFVPKGKKVVLGLVTSKSAQMESRDALKRRIDEAARYVPLEDLCLSPQCGFSSTHHGNALTESDQWRKLELIVEVAREVWG